MSTVDAINEQTGKPDQPYALSEEAEAWRARLRTAVDGGWACLPSVPEAARLLAILDAHANDLADMQRAVSQIEEVYYHITGGQLSKWQTDPVHIKQAHDGACAQAAKDERAKVLAELAVEFDTMDPAELQFEAGQAALIAKIRRNTTEAPDEKDGP